MKNKRLIWTLVFLAILTLGSIGTDLFKKEHQDANKVRQSRDPPVRDSRRPGSNREGN